MERRIYKITEKQEKKLNLINENEITQLLAEFDNEKPNRRGIGQGFGSTEDGQL